ncbi:hypothetical protein MKS88_005113 [Plasmodium brasilianum]|uniref:Uncharacterized protein n=2 Tax=Plasmodium (Plasmodium) TaxID=418103 RepID=A0A1A8WXN3_PLAMA|nr:conserved Plasmodium protein, unknown function [Plasmodium malariae]KAI4835895.1 hypothetical protein MKS88_005113 [Plasmodium brasilianum]SBS96643.1 conserved Plasmodium protein, unknown function [Plasmodium malariae]SCP02832.1 conserved Plasmodium protein, unknown function [Plasmodium malariae]
MNRIVKLKNNIWKNNFFRDILFSNINTRRIPFVDEKCEKNGEKVKIILTNPVNTNKDEKCKMKDYTCSLFFNDDYIIISNKNIFNKKLDFERKEKQILRFWNRSPGARYPKKANNGARPDCRSVRKIRKRFKTGK